MKIAILGGAFDPPHNGHLTVARNIKKILTVDEVWLMPVFSHPFDKHLSPTSHRFAMTKLLEDDGIKVSDFEIKQQSKSYTIDTLQLLSKQYPEYTFYWCIGSDTLPDFHKWKEWESLIKDYKIVVYPRKHIPFRNKYPSMIVLSEQEVEMTDVSSSLVRNLVKEDASIEHLVDPRVREYIRKHRLYGTHSDRSN